MNVELLHLLAALIKRDGPLFVSMSELQEVRLEGRLVVSCVESEHGYRIFFEDPNAPIDMGVAMAVDQRALPGPGRG